MTFQYWDVDLMFVIPENTRSEVSKYLKNAPHSIVKKCYK